MQRYKKAVDKGLLKVMSKMGISRDLLLSRRLQFRGDRPVARAGRPSSSPACSRASPASASPASRARCWSCTRRAWGADAVTLPVGGIYKLRRRGEAHGFEGNLIHTLQTAVATDSYATYRRYADAVRRLPPVALRDLLDFRLELCKPIPVDEVESITEIRKRLVAPGISLGALSPEAHETLSIAMNRIGARSDSGEGGEDPARAKPRAERRQRHPRRSSRSRRAGSASPPST